jgi:hypothetical protein
MDAPTQVRQALRQTGGNVVRAAALLGFTRSAMRHRLQRHGITSARAEAWLVPSPTHDQSIPPLVKVGIQHLRGMSDTTVLQKRIEVIAEVKALGYDEKHAAQVVERLLKSIRTRPDDDSVLKTLQKMLSS